ncbi:uncharacterized protein PHACADRAFT_251282 [Phanerochaete carnosa HHB-10118-sp]|uniref:Uncharacterized protein n=1 Tax=Phanerochaete carnosa (strain HHB-10118-sp) TaxID=650164 RepID=K5W158_PHACS|nr:uncharacterized protein PHACADRAFT_251282 [Phanerochaete carnosa HHB-10118-sp]EKM57588.1 hypothetical protein PHACADRAFT_251282 [Phanerochaete carnosa HHB-10118-sp]
MRNRSFDGLLIDYNEYRALLVTNILQLLTYNFSGFASFMTPFIIALPPVLINRFMINLRTTHSEVVDYTISIIDLQPVPPVRVPPASHPRRSMGRLGNMGEMLQDGWDDGDAWDEENSSAEADGAENRGTSAYA